LQPSARLGGDLLGRARRFQSRQLIELAHRHVARSPREIEATVIYVELIDVSDQGRLPPFDFATAYLCSVWQAGNERLCRLWRPGPHSLAPGGDGNRALGVAELRSVSSGSAHCEVRRLCCSANVNIWPRLARKRSFGFRARSRPPHWHDKRGPMGELIGREWGRSSHRRIGAQQCCLGALHDESRGSSRGAPLRARHDRGARTARFSGRWRKLSSYNGEVNARSTPV
jgi:hypothetical protein